MQFFYTNEDGTKEEVQLEPWAWTVFYKDGSVLKQFDPKGIFHRLGEIDQDQIEMVTMCNLENPEKRVDILWQDGMRLIHKYRNFKFAAGTEQEKHIRIYIFGYTVGDKAAYSFILPDGRVIQSNTIDVQLSKYFLSE